MTEMPQQWHTGEDISIHSSGYNQAWDQFIKEYPTANPGEIHNFMQQTTNNLGFGSLPAAH